MTLLAEQRNHTWLNFSIEKLWDDLLSIFVWMALVFFDVVLNGDDVVVPEQNLFPLLVHDNGSFACFLCAVLNVIHC